MAQAVFCHKCGERLEWPPSPAVPDDLSGRDAPGEAPPGEAPAYQAAAGPEASPAEKFAQASARTLGGDETERDLWLGGYSSKAMVGAWAVSGLVTLVLLIAGIAWVRDRRFWIVLVVATVLLWLYQFLKLCYRRIGVRYRLTNQRFIHETGILRRVTDRIEVIDMDDIAFEQSVLERLVGVGTIRISSSDRTHPMLVLVGIDRVQEVSEIIDDARRSERRRRGLHIESI